MTRSNFQSSGARILFAADAAIAAATPAKAAPVKTVSDDMDSRRIFTSTEDAAAYLNLCMNTFSDFATTPLAAPGLDMETGTFDPAIYVEGVAVMVATLREAKKGVKAIVIAPVPTLGLLLSDDAGTEWVTKIIQKELNHVAVRALRDASDISTVVDQMPTTRDAYISSARGDGGIIEAFNELYKVLNATMASSVKVWARAKLSKVELKRSLESKGYAEEYYPALENRGEGKDSLFIVALTLALGAAKKKGLDGTIFQRWLDTRASKTFDASKVEDDDDLDMSALTDSLLADTTKDEAKAADAAE